MQRVARYRWPEQGALEATKGNPAQAGGNGSSRKDKGRQRNPKGRRSLSGNAKGRLWNRQVEGKVPPEPIQPPDGTGCRCDFAGRWVFSPMKVARPEWAERTDDTRRLAGVSCLGKPGSMRRASRCSSTPGAQSTRGVRSKHHSGHAIILRGKDIRKSPEDRTGGSEAGRNAGLICIVQVGRIVPIECGVPVRPGPDQAGGRPLRKLEMRSAAPRSRRPMAPISFPVLAPEKPTSASTNATSPPDPNTGAVTEARL